jgi:3-dehydrosphinganine reductase
MQTNYFGSLNLARSVTPHMTTGGGGRLVFVASGAALIGIYGYSGYSSSKFAVRGLAEVLSVELAPHGIAVTLVHPPDTDTPGLGQEMAERPMITGAIARAAGIWDPEDVAAALVRCALRKQFNAPIGVQLRLLSALHSICAPVLRAYQGRVARIYR